MSLSTPVPRRALRPRVRAVPAVDGSWDIGGAPLQHTPFYTQDYQTLPRYRGAVAQMYPRSVDKAAPGSA